MYTRSFPLSNPDTASDFFRPNFPPLGNCRSVGNILESFSENESFAVFRSDFVSRSLSEDSDVEGKNTAADAFKVLGTIQLNSWQNGVILHGK